MQFFMDARLAIQIPERLTYEQGAAVGVGVEVSFEPSVR